VGGVAWEMRVVAELSRRNDRERIGKIGREEKRGGDVGETNVDRDNCNVCY
jgi:hypothetical protein